MRDPAVEKAYAGIPPYLFNDKDRPKRCPSCFGPMWPAFRRAWQSVVGKPGTALHAYVITCDAHYCRARAHEFARFE